MRKFIIIILLIGILGFGFNFLYGTTSDEKKEEIHFKNGKPDGKWISWYLSGKIESSYFYKNGEKHGKWQWWYENGKLKEESNWIFGERNGKYTCWFPNGQKSSDCSYKADTKHGKCVEWFENGIIKKSMRFKHGQREGRWITKFENGKIQSIESYSHDLKNGKYISFWENGKKEYECDYKNGFKAGKEIYWDEKGKKISEIFHKSVQPKRILPNIIFQTVNNQTGIRLQEFSLPGDIELGKPIPNGFNKEEEQLIFFSDYFLDQYQFTFNGIEFIITGNPGLSKEKNGVVIDSIICQSAGVKTPDGISVGDPLKYVLKIPGTSVKERRGFGYYVKLPSGWSAIFFQGEYATNGELDPNSKVHSIAMSYYLN